MFILLKYKSSAYIQRIVAPILLPMITRELRHVINKKAMTRAIDSAIDRSFCGKLLSYLQASCSSGHS